MPVPTSVLTELAVLQAQVLAASPLSNASDATVEAMQLNAEQLVNDIQTALIAVSVPTGTNTVSVTDGSLLDGWVAPIDPGTIASSLLTVDDAATNQSDLSLMRGVVGRVAANLNQIPQSRHAQ
jgi:hypothetical protein